MNLRDWLVEKQIQHVEFAETLNIGRAHLSSIVSGARRAGKKLARNIEKATRGDIRAADVLSLKATGYKGKMKKVEKRKQKKLHKNTLSLL